LENIWGCVGGFPLLPTETLLLLIYFDNNPFNLKYKAYMELVFHENLKTDSSCMREATLYARISCWLKNEREREQIKLEI
jgi:hypothetical protein